MTWVPAHKGIAGNEAADALAKSAVLSTNVLATLPEWYLYISRAQQTLPTLLGKDVRRQVTSGVFVIHFSESFKESMIQYTLFTSSKTVNEDGLSNCCQSHLC